MKFGKLLFEFNKEKFSFEELSVKRLEVIQEEICYRAPWRYVMLSSVTFVRPTQVVETFGNISSPLCILAII